VREHLVGHDLKEKRRNEREQLQEERCNQDLAQKAAVLVHRLEKPRDVKPSGEIGKGGSARYQDETARPVMLEHRR
jgi:hypothetical protein